MSPLECSTNRSSDSHAIQEISSRFWDEQPASGENHSSAWAGFLAVVRCVEEAEIVPEN
jgi:hypothetical protein